MASILSAGRRQVLRRSFLHAVRQPAVRARAARQNAADTFLCQCREETQGRALGLIDVTGADGVQGVGRFDKGQLAEQAFAQFPLHAEAGQIGNPQIGGHAAFDAFNTQQLNGSVQADVAAAQRVFKEQPEHALGFVDDQAGGQLLVQDSRIKSSGAIFI